MTIPRKKVILFQHNKHLPTQHLKKKEKVKKKKVGKPTKIDFYLSHLQKVTQKIIELGIKYLAVDAFYAKVKYVDGAIALGLHVISKLRKDARLRRPYSGPQKARGRKKKVDNSRVNFEDFKDSIVTKIANEQIELRSCVAYSVSLKRLIKVVLVRKLSNANSFGEAFLFSTDTERDALQIYQYYVARFQIGFIFRDAKGFTGLRTLYAQNITKIMINDIPFKGRLSMEADACTILRISLAEHQIKLFVEWLDYSPKNDSSYREQYSSISIECEKIIWKNS